MKEAVVMVRHWAKAVSFAPIALLAGTPAWARSESAASTDSARGKDKADIVVTAARTILPPNALPLTIDLIGKDELDQQIAISGSVTDAVAVLTPSFSPTRGKLSGSAKRCVAVRRFTPSTAFRNRPRFATAAATVSLSTVSSSTGWN